MNLTSQVFIDSTVLNKLLFDVHKTLTGLLIKTWIYNLARTIRFWINLHRVHKAKISKSQII